MIANSASDSPHIRRVSVGSHHLENRVGTSVCRYPVREEHETEDAESVGNWVEGNAKYATGILIEAMDRQWLKTAKGRRQ